MSEHALVDLETDTVLEIYRPGTGMVKVPDEDGTGYTWKPRDWSSPKRAILPVVREEVAEGERLVRYEPPVYDPANDASQAKRPATTESDDPPPELTRAEKFDRWLSGIDLTWADWKAEFDDRSATL